MKIDDLIEKINKDIFTPGFNKSKSILGGKYKLIADCIVHQGIPVLAISVIDSEMVEIGKAYFSVKNGLLNLSKNIEAYNIQIDNEHRRKGIATEIYKFVTELGNSVKPSNIQTDKGKAMWKGFKKNKIFK